MQLRALATMHRARLVHQSLILKVLSNKGKKFKTRIEGPLEDIKN